eukprot:703173-Amphidinium_carterae.1
MLYATQWCVVQDAMCQWQSAAMDSKIVAATVRTMNFESSAKNKLSMYTEISSNRVLNFGNVVVAVCEFNGQSCPSVWCCNRILSPMGLPSGTMVSGYAMGSMIGYLRSYLDSDSDS